MKEDSDQGGCLLGDLLDQATKLNLALRSLKGRRVDRKFLHLFTLGRFSQAQKLQEMLLTPSQRTDRGENYIIRFKKPQLTEEGEQKSESGSEKAQKKVVYIQSCRHMAWSKNLSRILTLDSNQGGCLLGDLLDQATKLTLALRSQKGRSVDWKFLHLFHTRFSQVQKRQEILLTPSQRTDRRGE